MFLLPALAWAQLAHVKRGSPVRGKGLALPTSGSEMLPASPQAERGSVLVSRERQYVACATCCQAPTWFLLDLYSGLMKTNTVSWHWICKQQAWQEEKTFGPRLVFVKQFSELQHSLWWMSLPIFQSLLSASSSTWADGTV